LRSQAPGHHPWCPGVAPGPERRARPGRAFARRWRAAVRGGTVFVNKNGGAICPARGRIILPHTQAGARARAVGAPGVAPLRPLGARVVAPQRRARLARSALEGCAVSARVTRERVRWAVDEGLRCSARRRLRSSGGPGRVVWSGVGGRPGLSAPPGVEVSRASALRRQRRDVARDRRFHQLVHSSIVWMAVALAFWLLSVL